MTHTYDYPRPMVTVDVFLYRQSSGKTELLLIQRKNAPYERKWALPGGYVDKDEDLEAAALRELVEETGVADVPLQQLRAYGQPGRDPRGHTITIVYGGKLSTDREIEIKAGDDAAKAKWFAIEKLPALAFDHEKIILECQHRL